MARNSRRADSESDRKTKVMELEEGSAVRRLEELPEEQEVRRPAKRRKKTAARRAGTIGRGYVVFLTMVCIAVAVLCVNYLRQKATITGQYESIAALESEYNQLKNDNDAKYNQVKGSVSMEDVKDAAENRLNMHYADSDQIMYYDLEDGSYVRQYQDVPAD